jgi:hypothetical protein
MVGSHNQSTLGIMSRGILLHTVGTQQYADHSGIFLFYAIEVVKKREKEQKEIM